MTDAELLTDAEMQALSAMQQKGLVSKTEVPLSETHRWQQAEESQGRRVVWDMSGGGGTATALSFSRPDEYTRRLGWHEIETDGFPDAIFGGQFFWCWIAKIGTASIMRYYGDYPRFDGDRILLQPVTHWLGPIEQPADPVIRQLKSENIEKRAFALAQEFVFTARERPDLATDEAAMTYWFTRAMTERGLSISATAPTEAQKHERAERDARLEAGRTYGAMTVLQLIKQKDLLLHELRYSGPRHGIVIGLEVINELLREK